MNAEKELLLALLIEKYTAPKPILKAAPTTPKRARKFKKPHHKWTGWEKRKLVGLKEMGKGWSEIAEMLGKGLSAKQCHSMYHNILVAERKIKNG
jgi:hypothetical protein